MKILVIAAIILAIQACSVKYSHIGVKYQKPPQKGMKSYFNINFKF